MAIYLWIAAIVDLHLPGRHPDRPSDAPGAHRAAGQVQPLRQARLQLDHPRSSRRMRQINITEMMVDAAPQEIITNDNLNARVDAQVYFQVKEDEASVKASQYNVNNFQWQIVNLARTTLRNIIGTLTLKSANSERGKINERAAQDPVARRRPAGASRSSGPSSRRSTRPRTSRRR
ncbi:MAG: SPFH domain-containing protein [Candidatus Moduliflexus flocculans]|nr:SPFH domain-containing protein [Candidatus Moduliflexus flocculans]